MKINVKIKYWTADWINEDVHDQRNYERYESSSETLKIRKQALVWIFWTRSALEAFIAAMSIRIFSFTNS